MKKQKPSAHSIKYEFKGLTDWFEVFRAGENVDSKGNPKTWTQADLDSMVENHNAEQPAPFVVGHPKTNDPAFGWTNELKRDGDVLLAKGKNIVPEFETAVAAKMYRNRSVSIVPLEDGYQLRHIGFLGAVAPAVPGLKEIQHSQEDHAETYEFAVEEAVRSMGWHFGSLGRVFRNIKNHFISENGLEAADQMIPEYVLENLTESSANVRADLAEPSLKTTSHFSADHSAEPITPSTPKEELDMPDPKTFSEQQLNDAVTAAVSAALEPIQAENTKLKTDAEQASFNGRLNDAKTLVAGLVEGGKLLPASSAGVAEFMANLAGEDATFEFSVSADEAAKKVTPFQFMSDFLNGLGKQIEFNMKRVIPEDALDKNDSVAIAKAAQEFVSAEAASGREISIANAVMHVTQTGADK